MSADDGIYIHHFKNGWRVVHGQAIENIWDNKTGGYDRKELKRYFWESPLYKTRDEAWEYGRKLAEKVGWTEYGISEV